MSFFSALLVWLVIAAVLVAAVAMAVIKGGLWLAALAVVLILFVGLFAVYGCVAH